MENLSETVLAIVRQTRDITFPYFGNVEVIGKKSASAHDVVTDIDNKVEIFLRDELKKVFPDIEFVGEEYGGNYQSKKFWLVDPVDGTGLFVRGIPFCTTMLALIEDDKVIFSAIYDFVYDVMYHAEKGKGAYKNGERIHVSERSADDSFIGYDTNLSKPENSKVIIGIRKISSLYKSMGAGYEYALIAEGKLEGRVTVDPWGKEYDFAPGSLLVEEAGGIVRNIGKKDYSYKNLNFIAANKALYEKLTQGPDAPLPVIEN